MNQPMYNGSAQAATLTYDKQLIIEAKIPLFELEKRSMSRHDTNDVGYANCRAVKNDNSNRLAIQLKWYFGGRGYVRYSRDENGRYVAYCPDDPYWYNRTLLSSTIRNSRFTIAKYINELGLITVGSEITDEINFIGTMIHDWVAKIDGVVVIRSKDEMEVKEYVNQKRSQGIAIQGPVWGLVKRIENIRENNRHDWMFSTEYQQDIIPWMKKQIRDRAVRDIQALKVSQPELMEAATKVFPEILKQMSFKQINEIAKKKKEELDKEGTIIKGKLYLEGVPLERLKVNDIRTIAVKKFNILTDGKTREELIEMIKEKIRENSDDVNDVVGPPTPEEIRNRKNAGLPELETIESI